MPPPRYRPQLATLVEKPPSGPQWLHEIKFDGYRMGCVIDQGSVRFESRASRNWTADFPELVAAAHHLPVRSAVLDGEAAMLMPNGLTSFQALQNSFSGAPRAELVYFVFDVLHVDGRDVAALPLEQRKRECQQLLRGLPSHSPFRYSQHFDVDGPALLARACAMGAEGIVSKRRDLAHRPGRTDGWLKSKCTKTGVFVIGGFTGRSGTRAAVGALLLGHYDGRHLRFAGKVGTGAGWTANYLGRLRTELDAIAQPECPFDPAPPGWIGRNGHWVAPIRCGTVTFTEWTQAGTLRHPSFQGFTDASPDDSAPRRSPRRPGATPPPPSGPGRSGRGTTPPGLEAPPAPPGGVLLTSPERQIYPALHFTKRDLAEFYVEVAPWLLPYIAKRPLTLVRCPDGIQNSNALRDECQFLPHTPGWSAWAPNWIRRVQIQEQRKVGEYLVVDSPEALRALVQGDILELHVWNATIDHLETPDRIVLDLDPGSGISWQQTVAAALQVRSIVSSLGLECWPKLTGGKGVHVVVPFQPEHGWPEIYALAHRLARAAVELAPATFTTSFAKDQRSSRILVDYKRNHRGAVAVAAYSARARPNGAVAATLSWRQLAVCASPDVWTVANVRQRLRRLKADPWRDFWTCRQRLSR